MRASEGRVSGHGARAVGRRRGSNLRAAAHRDAKTMSSPGGSQGGECHPMCETLAQRRHWWVPLTRRTVPVRALPWCAPPEGRWQQPSAEA